MFSEICKWATINAVVVLVLNETAGSFVAGGVLAVECVLGLMFWSMGR